MKQKKEVRDRYAIIIGSGTWVMSLIIRFLINIAFSSNAFFSILSELKLPKQTSENVISQQASWQVDVQRGK